MTDMKKNKKILIIHGPNLNTLGKREPHIYGDETLDDINQMCRDYGLEKKLEIDCFQSNVEGEIVSEIQKAKESHQAIIINAGAYTHTSIAIYDALKYADIPTIEVHLSNIFQREEMRHHSYISPIAIGIISGLGSKGYIYAIDALENYIH